jgi:hypothetical protein
MQVNPVQQRAGNAGAVALDGQRGTGTAVGGITEIAAGAGVC